MANRNTLHKNHLHDFRKWLIRQAWIEEPLKGDWEVLRTRKGNTILIVHTRMDSEHLTVEDRFSGLVRRFLRVREDITHEPNRRG